MSKIVEFENECQKNIVDLGQNRELKDLSYDWCAKSGLHKYTYNFKWMGMPIIQYPQDMIALQEVIWKVQPDLIIETGVAHGGSIIFYASLLELINNGEVLGIDIDIRSHNRARIENHPMFKRITLFEGSSISQEMVEKVHTFSQNKKKVLLILDSNHTHEHVLKELEFYSPLIARGSYIIVMDTLIEHMPEDYFPERPWGKGDNPKTAVHAFLQKNDRFEIDDEIQNKLLITVAPDGYLKCIR